MTRAVHRSVTLGLTACLMLLHGMVFPQTVEHAIHHARHQAATHATVLCTWMCAAGEILDAYQVPFENKPLLAGEAETWVPVLSPPLLSVVPVSRPPPLT